jgi:hypothetical protein
MAIKPSKDVTVPDPADIYERAHPAHESGMGRLDNNNDAVPEDRADVIEKTVPNRHSPKHQINSDDEGRKV